MEALSDFVADLLDAHGAVVEKLAPDGLEVLAPAAVSRSLGWPEIARLGFAVELPEGAIRIGLEGDWLGRFAALLDARGRWAERQVVPTEPPPPPDPERLIAASLDLPNAIWRFQRMTPTWTRCLILTFRYTAISDEKREGLVRLAFNLGTGATLDDAWLRRHAGLSEASQWQAPDPAVRDAAGPGWEMPGVEARVRPLLDYRVKQELQPFLRSMRRRLDRDRTRVHGYHSDLRSVAQKRLAGLADASGEKPEADRRRETLRLAAIEREYRAKLDDLRHNYALRVTVEWVQALELYLPVQRLDVLIRRRKGERVIRFDWDQSTRMAEFLPCDWGLGLDRVRLVCDEKLHLTEPAGQAPCRSCGKPWCRACHPASCPRCAAPVDPQASEVPGRA